MAGDRFTKAERSRVMAAIRGKGNKGTELKVIEIFRAAGIRGWRRGSKLPGKPDFVFSRAKLAVFVDGCFWHGCKQHCRRPGSRQEYWHAKIDRNMRRDREVRRLLKEEGWRCLRLWEHSLKSPEAVARKVRRALEL